MESLHYEYVMFLKYRPQVSAFYNLLWTNKLEHLSLARLFCQAYFLWVRSEAKTRLLSYLVLASYLNCLTSQNSYLQILV
jgi:hypothetical protein